MSTAAPLTRYTPADLLRLPDSEGYELLDGQLVERDRSLWSSYVAGRMYRLLSNHAPADQSGWVLPEGASYQCFPDAPNKVRRADVSFRSPGRRAGATPGGFIRQLAGVGQDDRQGRPPSWDYKGS